MEISYYNDATKNNLVVRCGDPEGASGYQYRMISCNRIPGLLPCSLREIDGEAYLVYDVTGLSSLARLCQDRDLERERLRELLYAIAGAGKVLARYLLDFAGLALSPELIFYDYGRKQYLFLYNPGKTRQETLARFLLYAQKKIRPGEKNLELLLYRLQDLSDNPNFILKEEMLDDLLREPAPESEPAAGQEPFSRPGRSEYFAGGPEPVPAGQQAGPDPAFWQQGPSQDPGPAPAPSPQQQERAAKKQSRRGKKMAGTFVVAISLLLCAIGTELANLYLPLPSGIALILRALLLGFLVAAVVIAAYGTVLSFQKVRREEETPAVVPAPAPAPAAYAASSWSDPQQDGRARARREWARDPAGAGAGMPCLAGVEGAAMYAVRPSALPCTIGSDPALAGAVLPDPSIGRIHARISRDRDGEYLLTDCGSRYGTFLNGVRLMPNESMALQRNDQVRLGNLSFVFR
ncbi:MAG: DUF6382 domain-containing protein [Lachnospiraceae bacterium]|jgi:hypothetical protein|nr:DUF6382 domain-containing protein [Lachnospiraceae bacterium]MCI1398542.1 DUF6382 domain-containing protein [Lachnospiraceae bacterium]MCI1424661.1 DUF6382 domain-containing protein [Lachnospiraceae bacterium]MCI1453402.1 DUF6382 domain-containing protein [Lachnospiraceae bacterium]